MAGEVRIQTVVHLIKFGAYRQFSVPKPPLLLAANRYAQCRGTDTVLRTLAHLLAAHSRATPNQAKEPSESRFENN